MVQVQQRIIVIIYNQQFLFRKLECYTKNTRLLKIRCFFPYMATWFEFNSLRPTRLEFMFHVKALHENIAYVKQHGKIRLNHSVSLECFNEIFRFFRRSKETRVITIFK